MWINPQTMRKKLPKKRLLPQKTIRRGGGRKKGGLRGEGGRGEEDFLLLPNVRRIFG
jgi:hypothetical protein